MKAPKTRAAAPLSRNWSPKDKEAIPTRKVLERLTDVRLLTTSENGVEVAHEALIREWSRLQDWLNEDRESLKLHRSLTEAAHEWELLERDPGALYRGARLASALEFAAANSKAMNAQERAFLEASQAEQVREEREKEAQQLARTRFGKTNRRKRADVGGGTTSARRRVQSRQ